MLIAGFEGVNYFHEDDISSRNRLEHITTDMLHS